jgi:hypothetical protein
MNKRTMKCNTSVLAVGQENSLADLEEKKNRCLWCCAEKCEYKDEYIREYQNAISRIIHSRKKIF